MILYANGCSFTAGHGDVHDSKGKLVPPRDFTCPHQISQFDSVINQSRRGGSNDRILRTTIDYFTKKPSAGYVAVIQWTSPIRFEKYFPLFNCWAEFCNITSMEVNSTLKHSNNPIRYSLHVDDETIQRKFFRRLEEYDMYHLIDTSTNVLKFAKEVNDYLIDFYKTVLIMQQFLESKNIPYIFTSMSWFNFLKADSTYMGVDKFDISWTDYEFELFRNINQDVWTAEPLSALAKDHVVSPTDNHPDELGHKVIAGSITSTLKERGII